MYKIFLMAAHFLHFGFLILLLCQRFQRHKCTLPVHKLKQRYICVSSICFLCLSLLSWLEFQSGGVGREHRVRRQGREN